MAQQYSGYGFNVYDLSGAGILNFIRTQSPDDYEKMIRDTFGEEKIPDTLTKEELEILEEDPGSWVENNTPFMFLADYITTILCVKTCADLFRSLDAYVLYPPLKFPDDATEEKKKFIKNAGDLQALVLSFFPGEEIIFGSIWLSEPDWIEPNYVLEIPEGV